jgi:NitT/TauT family transport system permease protein
VTSEQKPEATRPRDAHRVRRAAGSIRDQLARWTHSVRPVALLIVLLLIGWEALKLIGGSPIHADLSLAGNQMTVVWHPPLRIAIASDLDLPHLWDIAAAFASPAQRGGPPLVTDLIGAALFTLREAATGFLLGAGLGMLLAVFLVRWEILDRALTPYLVASQTIPIVAIAPMVVIWLRAGWLSVAVISAYLTFFPVAMAGLRGLRAVQPEALELMQSYAAGSRQTLFVVRLPSAAPYLFAGLKLAAAASIIGAIIGELPSGLDDGLGTRLLAYSQYYITGPERLWAAIVVSAGAGLFAFAMVNAVEGLVLSGRARLSDV